MNKPSVILMHLSAWVSRTVPVIPDKTVPGLSFLPGILASLCAVSLDPVEILSPDQSNLLQGLHHTVHGSHSDGGILFNA